MSVPTAAISSVEHFYEFALEAIHQGNYDYAIRKLRFGIQWYPKDSRLHSLLSQAYFDTDELELARSYANTALKLDFAKEFTSVLDEDLSDRIDRELDDIEDIDDDSDRGPEPDSCVPRCPKDPTPTSGIALNPYAVPVPVP